MSPIVINQDLTDAEASLQEALCRNSPGGSPERRPQPNGKYTVICTIPDPPAAGAGKKPETGN